MIEFENEIAEKYDLDVDAARLFLRRMRFVEVPKNVHVIKTGEFNDNFYFIKKGILRAYMPVNDIEQILWFGYPGQAIIDVWCYHHGGLSPISIEAVIPAELCWMPKSELEALCAESLPVCNLARKIFIGHATEAEESFTSLFDKDVKLCAYFKLGLSIKQIAKMLSVLPESINTSRYRLRRKMGLEGDTAIEDILREI